MKRVLRKWNLEDNELLLEAAKKHSKNGRVQWQEVALLFPERTPNQCKTQFINKQGEPERRNMDWSVYEMKMLYSYVLMHGKKWTFICKTFYDGRFQPEALIHKFHEI